jgi:hypothetical protein
VECDLLSFPCREQKKTERANMDPDFFLMRAIETERNADKREAEARQTYPASL